MEITPNKLRIVNAEDIKPIKPRNSVKNKLMVATIAAGLGVVASGIKIADTSKELHHNHQKQEIFQVNVDEKQTPIQTENTTTKETIIPIIHHADGKIDVIVNGKILPYEEAITTYPEIADNVNARLADRPELKPTTVEDTLEK